MNHHIGLWIDHRRAVIVLHAGIGQEPTIILSHADRHQSRQDGECSGESFESLQIKADDVQDRKFANQLNSYYDEVIGYVHTALELYVFGPGEAKGEFVKRLGNTKPSTREVDVESSDKLTDRQVVAKVRDHYQTATPTIML
jgi:hypothetical protein